MINDGDIIINPDYFMGEINQALINSEKETLTLKEVSDLIFEILKKC